MEELITIYCKNTNQYYDVPIGSSLLDIYKVAGFGTRSNAPL